MNAIFVEDSEKDLKVYKNLFKDFDGAEILFAYSAEVALNIADVKQIDMFFIDIELPGMNGFELAKKLRDMPNYVLTPIIFITGHEGNQLEAFKDYHCYDYIKKPFVLEDLKEKTKYLIEKAISTDSKEISQNSEMIPIYDDEKTTLIPLDELLYVEIQGRYVKVVLYDKKLNLNDISLKSMVKQINNKHFIRCHKNYAVNIKKLSGIKQINYRSWRGSFKLSEKEVEISKSFYDEVYGMFNLLKKEGE